MEQRRVHIARETCADERNHRDHCGQVLASMSTKIRFMDDPAGRVLQLLSLLQTHRFWPGGELAGRLGVSARTLRRDIDRLRRLGYPVDANPGLDGGYRLAAGTHMPPLLLDDEEAVAIAVGLRAAASASVDGIEETSLRALAKLEQVLPDRLRRRVKAVYANVVPMRWDAGTGTGTGTGATVDAEALALLAQACRDGEQVRFEYRRKDGEETRRLVEPHQLVSAGRRWYLVAWDVRRSDWRTFRLDRLAEPALAGARFPARSLPAADAATFVAQSIRSMPAPHFATVVVFGPLEAVRRALRWTDGDIEPVDEARCRVSIRAETLDWVVSAVAMIAVAFDVEVIEPPEVVTRTAELARRLAPS